MALAWRSIVVPSLVACIGCGPSLVGEGDEANDSTTDTDATDPTATATDPTASATATVTATDPTATATDPSVSATDPSASATATVTATDPTTDPSFTATATVSATDPTATTDPTDTSDTSGELPNGEPCGDDSECVSGHCYALGPLGAICGECELDDDCPGGGCTPPNPLSDPPQGSVCNAGEYGAGCMSDAACEPSLQCALVLDVPGVITVSTCSECVDDAQCDPGFVCAPDIAVVGTINGVKRCVAEGTLVNGQSCDFTTSGDTSCASGFCAIADVMGILLLGVCSECEADDDCVAGLCQPPQVSIEQGFVAGSCG